MKKRIVTFMMAAAVMCSVALSSCSKSNKDLLNEYRATANEFVEAVKSQDEAKIKSVSEKGDKIVKELRERDLTEEEQKEFASISIEMLSGSIGGAMEGMDL